MAFFIYSDQPGDAAGKTTVPMEKWNANRGWANHFYNVHVLSHISATTKDAREKLQAENEIVIGRRKMAWWERHQNWTRDGAHATLRATYKIGHC